MKLITKKRLTGLIGAMVFAVVAAFTPAAPTYAADCSSGTAGGASAGINCARGDEVPGEDLFNGEDSIFKNVVNIMLFIIGALSVVMLIWGGIRYTTSGGQSAAVTSAKNTIMYSIIGLVVAFLAFAIVNWVLNIF